MQKQVQLGWTKVSDLTPNPWNTNSVNLDNERKLDASLDRFGMFKPVVVRTLPDGRKQILGGEHRWKAAQRAGEQTIPIVDVGEVTDAEAKEIGLVDNGRYGSDDAIALAQLLEGLGEDDLTSFLPYSDTDLEMIFASTKVDLSELGLDDDDDEMGNISDLQKPIQTHQVMRFKVPVDDAHLVSETIERVMKEQGFIDDDSLTNAGNALVNIFQEITNAKV